MFLSFLSRSHYEACSCLMCLELLSHTDPIHCVCMLSRLPSLFRCGTKFGTENLRGVLAKAGTAEKMPAPLQRGKILLLQGPFSPNIDCYCFQRSIKYQETANIFQKLSGTLVLYSGVNCVQLLLYL